MRKLVKNIKLMVTISTMLAMFAIAPVVYGGITPGAASTQYSRWMVTGLTYE